MAQTDSSIAIVTLDRPPVNALSYAVVADTVAAIETALADPQIVALVLTGAGGIFTGGADLHEFAAPMRHPNVRDLVALLEASPKPIVAAIDGICLGGGLEAALACDLRVASPRATFAFPEIKRGVLPGAGGTQRAPRAIGMAKALALVLSGEPIAASDALAMGLIHAIAVDDFHAVAIARARALAGLPRQRVSARSVAADERALQAARERALPIERGGLAAHRAIDTIAAAAELPFAEGLAREAAAFDELVASERSRARIYAFFAEREAARLPDFGPVPKTAIARALIVGSGTMGSGIAIACVDAGMSVTISDIDRPSLERARARIGGIYDAAVAKGRLDRAGADARVARIAYAETLDAAAACELVIEAAYEDMTVKQNLFRALDARARPGTILATNTSSLDIDAIAAVTSRPADVVGLHFFSPANIMRLLEIVRGAATAQQTLATALGIAKQLGKIGVISGNCDGFIGNRMLAPYRREAEFLLEEGGTPAQIDGALKRFGFAMGPFAVSDLAGLDIGWSIRKRRNAAKPPVGRYSRVADTLCEMGRFGQKTGAGYYLYAPGDRTPHPDPEVDAVVLRLAEQANIARRALADDEIVWRCVLPLVNEAAKILAEGMAVRASDIDVVWVHGYGFPAFRGGPLRYADSLGLEAVVARMRAFERTHGAVWTPAPLLVRLAETGGSFTGTTA